MKKLLQISNYYAPDIGGIEAIAEAVSDAVKDRMEVRVLCFSHTKKGGAETRGGVPVMRCATHLKLFSQQLSFSMPFAMRRVLKEYHPDTVLLHMPNPFLAFLVLRLLPKETELILYWHSDIVRQKRGEKLFRGMFFKLLKRAGSVIVTSPNYLEKSLYLQAFRDRLIVIPNCIRESSLVPEEESLRFAKSLKNAYPGKTLLVGLGTQVYYKGFVHLIRAVKKLDDRFILFLVGRPGNATAEIQKEAEGVPNVVFAGSVSETEKKGYLLACDIFCFSSVTRNEAFGVALAEAMYYGKPAVTFTIPGSGVNYVSLDKVTGLEVPNADEDAYAGAIRLLSEDGALRREYGENAAARVKELFLYESFADRVRELLCEET